MPRPRTLSQEVILHFTWRVYCEKNGTWQADGRSNATRRRLTLGCGSKAEALEALREADRMLAVKHGLIAASSVGNAIAKNLTVADALEKYLDDVASRKVTLDVSDVTIKRYRAIVDKFLAYCGERHVVMMLAITRELVLAYLAELKRRGYSYATTYIEATTLKQTVRFLIEKGLLPETSRLRIRMRKPTESRTYCYTDNDIKLIVRRCLTRPGFRWLHAIVLALAYTGLRISELRQLRWSNIDFEIGMIRLRDDRFSGALGDEPIQTLKGKRPRELPIAAPLRPILEERRRTDTVNDGFVFHGAKGGRIKPDKVRRALLRDVLRPIRAGVTDNETDDVEGTGTFEPANGDGGGDRGCSAVARSLVGDGLDKGRLHSFRHYFVSTCANNNVPEQMLLAWLGHQNSKLIRRYYHVHQEPAKSAMNSIAWPSLETC